MLNHWFNSYRVSISDFLLPWKLSLTSVTTLIKALPRTDSKSPRELKNASSKCAVIETVEEAPKSPEVVTVDVPSDVELLQEIFRT